jgi:hypothetical protein
VETSRTDSVLRVSLSTSGKFGIPRHFRPLPLLYTSPSIIPAASYHFKLYCCLCCLTTLLHIGYRDYWVVVCDVAEQLLVKCAFYYSYPELQMGRGSKVTWPRPLTCNSIEFQVLQCTKKSVGIPFNFLSAYYCRPFIRCCLLYIDDCIFIWPSDCIEAPCLWLSCVPFYLFQGLAYFTLLLPQH